MSGYDKKTLGSYSNRGEEHPIYGMQQAARRALQVAQATGQSIAYIRSGLEGEQLDRARTRLYSRAGIEDRL